MRTLSGTLQSAQAAPLATPCVRVTRRPASAGEDRFSPLSFFAGHGSAAEPFALTVNSGTLRVWVLRSGFFAQDQYGWNAGVLTYNGSANGQATTETLIAAAVHPNGTTIFVVTCNVGDTSLHVHVSTDAGSTWATENPAFPITTSGYGAQNIACAMAGQPSSTYGLFIIVQGLTTDTFVIRTSSGVYASSTASETHYSAHGIGCIASGLPYPNDLVVVAAGGYNTAGVFSEVVAYLVGDNLLISGGVFTAHQTVLVTTPFSLSVPQTPGTQLAVGGICLADTYRFTVQENYQNPVAGINTTRLLGQSFLKEANVLAGYARDPVPLPVLDGALLRPAYDAANNVLFYAQPAGIYFASQPQTVDLSSRVLRATRIERETAGEADLLLDDADGALTALALSADTAGQRLTVDFGYVTGAGQEFSASAPLWISAVHASARAGERHLELVAADGWHLLSAWKPRRSYAWLPGQSTIQQILQWILARVGLDFTIDGSPSTLLNTQPAFIIHPDTTGAAAAHELLDMVPEVLYFTASGAALRNPQANDAPVYSYSPAGHQVLATRLTLFPQGLNHVLVYGKLNGAATTPSLLAEAVDAADAQRLADYPHVLRDMQLSVANAPARAGVALRKAQMLTDRGEIASHPNVGLELFDPVNITEAPLGLNGLAARVRELHTLYDLLSDGGVYTQSVALMNP